MSTETHAQLVNLIELRFNRGTGMPDDPVREVVSYRHLDGELIAECDPCAENVLVAAPRKKVAIPRLRVGDERIFTLQVRARVTETCDANDVSSYELELERRMFNEGRLVGIDADEIIELGMVPR